MFNTYFIIAPLHCSIAKKWQVIFSVPFPQDKEFVFRQHIFSQIETGFCDGRPVALRQCSQQAGRIYTCLIRKW